MADFNTNESLQSTSTLKSKGAGYYFLQLIRIIVGVLFIFSGLIKANDPSGLAYKMEEFFELWEMTYFSPYSLGFSIAIIAFEIVAGVAVLLGYAFRQFAFLLLLLMLFFTFLTGYAIWFEYANQRELKCGCFGDCIPLTAMQSFIKDLILLAMVMLLLLGRKRISGLFRRPINTSLLILSLVFSVFIQWYALQHLPYVDCLPYKVGNNIYQKMQPPPGSYPDEYALTYTMKHTQTGETKVMSSQEYMDSNIWQDTLNWQLFGEPEQKLIKKGNNTPEIKDFIVQDFEGEDYTEALIKEPGYNFLFFVKDVKKVPERNMDRLKKLFAKAEKSNIGYYLLSASNKEETEKFVKDNGLNIYYFAIDGTVCKTAMRSNPGLMLLKGGTVMGKWSYNDYPKDFAMKGDKLEIK